MELHETHVFKDGVERQVYKDGNAMFAREDTRKCPVCFHPPWDGPSKPITDVCPDCKRPSVVGQTYMPVGHHQAIGHPFSITRILPNGTKCQKAFKPDEVIGYYEDHELTPCQS